MCAKTVVEGAAYSLFRSWRRAGFESSLIVMPVPRFFDVAHRRGFSQVLKGIRRARGLTVADAAAAMGMPTRSYQYFESARSRFDFAVIARFGAAMNADPFAIVAAVQFASPAFAVRTADNRLMTLLMSAIAAFDDEAASLDALYLRSRFLALADEMAQEARARRSL